MMRKSDGDGHAPIGPKNQTGASPTGTVTSRSSVCNRCGGRNGAHAERCPTQFQGLRDAEKNRTGEVCPECSRIDYHHPACPRYKVTRVADLVQREECPECGPFYKDSHKAPPFAYYAHLQDDSIGYCWPHVGQSTDEVRLWAVRLQGGILPSNAIPADDRPEVQIQAGQPEVVYLLGRTPVCTYQLNDFGIAPMRDDTVQFDDTGKLYRVIHRMIVLGERPRIEVHLKELIKND